jgi:Leucine-rich repeat (LRR) protein
MQNDQIIKRTHAHKICVLLLAMCLVLLPLGCGSEPVAAAVATPEPTPAVLDLSNSGITDITSLLERTDLSALDLRGNEIPIRDFNALSVALPDCEILWSVPVGNERFDSDSTSLALTDVPDDLVDILEYFPVLEEVSAEGAANYSALAAAGAAYPTVQFHWSVSLGDESYAQDTQTIDLSGQTVDAAALQAALPGLPELTQITFDETGAFTTQEQIDLVQAFPNISFVWDVQLLDELSVRSDVTEIDLRDYDVDDVETFSDTLVLLPGLVSIDMCGCGPSNDEMAALKERYPDTKFIWYIRVSGWLIRTDIKGFSTGNRYRFPDGGGWFVVDSMPYSRIFVEDFENLKYCTDLVALDFGHCMKISDISFIANLPKLKYLIFSMCSVDDISVLADQTELEFLEIKNNQITDITPLRNCTKLRFLNCGINDLDEIDTFLALPNLERLWINCTLLTDEQLEELRAAMPNTTITAHPTHVEYGESLWRKGNEGYLAIQKIFGMRAQNQGTVDSDD